MEVILRVSPEVILHHLLRQAEEAPALGRARAPRPDISYAM